jgi:hypothetical protein
MKTHESLMLLNADPYTTLVAAVDDAFMRLYAAARRNARRMARLSAALFPLVVVLVGSCKGVSMNGSYARLSAADELRAALFPDRAVASGEYRPAAGYVTSARAYVAAMPEALKLLTDREIGYLFGAPALTRTDADARILQYRGESCVVDFYFYGRKPLADTPVSYVDIRRKPGSSPGCIGDVIAERRTSGA